MTLHMETFKGLCPLKIVLSTGAIVKWIMSSGLYLELSKKIFVR